MSALVALAAITIGAMALARLRGLQSFGTVGGSVLVAKGTIVLLLCLYCLRKEAKPAAIEEKGEALLSNLPPDPKSTMPPAVVQPLPSGGEPPKRNTTVPTQSPAGGATVPQDLTIAVEHAMTMKMAATKDVTTLLEIFKEVDRPTNAFAIAVEKAAITTDAWQKAAQKAAIAAAKWYNAEMEKREKGAKAPKEWGYITKTQATWQQVNIRAKEVANQMASAKRGVEPLASPEKWSSTQAEAAHTTSCYVIFAVRAFVNEELSVEAQLIPKEVVTQAMEDVIVWRKVLLSASSRAPSIQLQPSATVAGAAVAFRPYVATMTVSKGNGCSESSDRVIRSQEDIEKLLSKAAREIFDNNYSVQLCLSEELAEGQQRKNKLEDPEGKLRAFQACSAAAKLQFTLTSEHHGVSAVLLVAPKPEFARGADATSHASLSSQEPSIQPQPSASVAGAAAEFQPYSTTVFVPREGGGFECSENVLISNRDDIAKILSKVNRLILERHCSVQLRLSLRQEDFQQEKTTIEDPEGKMRDFQESPAAAHLQITLTRQRYTDIFLVEPKLVETEKFATKMRYTFANGVVEMVEISNPHERVRHFPDGRKEAGRFAANGMLNAGYRMAADGEITFHNPVKLASWLDAGLELAVCEFEERLIVIEIRLDNIGCPLYTRSQRSVEDVLLKAGSVNWDLLRPFFKEKLDDLIARRNTDSPQNGSS